ncbi:hypothetical protein CERZMDRAFT_89642 [Cercospora zeae-maydis SCOH1-5]|uniref:Uncharacterized protein n=1 Tax=Cercospora zeae-maydis SCOH1-5 TaxID=717836 RepID=A0A6A6FWQ5_9PEZI|nr:hypothetical protein CERZMDRAFT_89642 [Cercospora zeae-maydis SCOH1-5]
MSNGYESKYAAKRALGTFKESDPDDKAGPQYLKVDRRVANRAHLTKVLDLYISANHPGSYESILRIRL